MCVISFAHWDEETEVKLLSNIVLPSCRLRITRISAKQYHRAFPVNNMTPIWIFPAYPMLLVAPFAAQLIDGLPDAAAAAKIHSTAIAYGAVCVQGTGFLVSLMLYAAFMYRLMTQKLPKEKTRPGMVSKAQISFLLSSTNLRLTGVTNVTIYFECGK